MATRDPRVDAYIGSAQPFARPILTRLRKVVHTASPGVVEGWKWSRGIIKADDKAMGQFGRITSMDDLPSDKALIAIIKAAAKLNDDGVRVVKAKPASKPPVKTPPYFTTALKQNKKALAAYQDFSSSCKREYVEWVTEAKTAETRQRRLETAVTWIAEGKGRNWKYER